MGGQNGGVIIKGGAMFRSLGIDLCMCETGAQRVLFWLFFYKK